MIARIRGRLDDVGEQSAYVSIQLNDNGSGYSHEVLVPSSRALAWSYGTSLWSPKMVR